MEIDNNRVATLVTTGSKQGTPVENPQDGKSGASPETANSANSTADSVSLTGEARQMQTLEARIASTPVVDTQRVQSVRSAVENGTFTVNPVRIADKMIDLEQALTGIR